METPMVEKFKVVAVSENTNSFGLKQMKLVGKSGVLYTACANYLNVRKEGETFLVDTNGKGDHFFNCFELVERHGSLSKAKVSKIFGKN